MSALLQLRHVTKSFRGLSAVTSVSLAVEPGAIVALIGPNGAGKTTLFNLVAGTLRPDSGEIHFNGARIDGLRPDLVCGAGIGRTFQIVKPFAGLSVLDNVVVGALKRAAGVAEAKRHGANIIAQLGLRPKDDWPASALTLPDQKRLEVARALATRPKLLLLDEVMAGLRPTECDEMVALFREINRREGLTILLVEHVMRAIMALADSVVVLHHGEVIAQDAPAEVVRNPTVLDCYLGEDTEL
jgi:branched-chain amino acid transport system ATP-binding protein